MRNLQILKRLLLISVFFAQGCASVQYYKEGVTQEEANRDTYDCRNLSAQSANNWGSPGNPFMIANGYDDCMKNKYGYKAVAK